MASRSTVCQGDTAVFIYSGSHLSDLTYDWKTPVGRSLILDGSGQGPIIVQFDSSGVINVRVQVNNRGCIGKKILFPVTVNPRPSANAVVKRDVCVDEVVDVSLNRVSPEVTSFVWDLGVAEIRYGGSPGGPHGVQWKTPATNSLR